MRLIYFAPQGGDKDFKIQNKQKENNHFKMTTLPVFPL